MKVRALKTHKITHHDHNLIVILDKYVKKLPENSILVITSKIVSLCEGRMLPVNAPDKKGLIKKESEWYLLDKKSVYNVPLTIRHNMIIPFAGIDESNSNGFYVLWPKDPQKTANAVWRYLKEKFKLQHVGVLITDSTVVPLRLGVRGIALAYCGFRGIESKVGKPDIFGRKLTMTHVHVADGLAAASVVVMGEADEQTPLAVITEIPFVHFTKNIPAKKELKKARIDPKNDLYAPLLSAAQWKRGEV